MGLKRPSVAITHIKVFHWSILILLLAVVVLIILIVIPPPSPIHFIELSWILRSESQPLHPRTTFRPLADLEAVDPRMVYLPSSAFLPTVWIGVREGGRLSC